MALITTYTVPAIQDLIKKSFTQGLKKDAGDIRKLFHPESQDWTTNKKRIQEFDRERLAETKVEGQNAVQRGVAEGYYKEFTRKTIAVEKNISGEASKAMHAHKLAENVTAVAEDVVDKIELDLRNYIGYGTASSYTDNGGHSIDTTVGDGLSLFNTTHTLKYSSTTYSNILSGAPSLSEDAMEGGEDFFSYNVLDNYGKRLSMKANVLITSDSATMRNRAKRMLMSISPEKVEGTANANANVTNVYKNKVQHLVIPFDVDSEDISDSTKKFYWYLASIGGSPRTSFQAYYIKWMSPMVAPAEVNQRNWTISYVARASYSYGAVSGKGIVVSQATS